MTMRASVTRAAVDHPVLVVCVMALVTAAFIVLAGAPSLWPGAFPFLHGVKVDTDPENMLREDEPVRVLHDRMKKAFVLHDMVVVGVVNDAHPDGVFKPASLGRIYQLTEFAKTLRWPAEDDPQRLEGVVSADVIAPSTVDTIEQGGLGTVRFEWLMPRPPETDEEALAVRRKAQRIPFLNGTLVSDDGKALALYLPLTRKDLAHRVSSRLQEKIAGLGGPEDWHITGLPVAEDTFGVEMFKQMAISAPLAMLVIFLLLFLFFRKLLLIVQPLILAMVSVIWTMGLLVATGQTIHIMSSMIPIFIMPIAVLDSIHILSEFFDRYQETRDRRRTIVAVMDTLFAPMLYTSLTTAAGFASLALTPIPPVQVFGLYVAFGVMAAWVLTVTFIPATVMFIPPKYLETFGLKKSEEEAHAHTPVSRLLRAVGRGTTRFAPLILVATGLAVAVAGYGISRIRINDNPTKWFEADHPIRVADRVLNSHFGGTYMAYLELEPADWIDDQHTFAMGLKDRLRARSQDFAADSPQRQVFEALADKALGGVPLEEQPDRGRSAAPGELLAHLAAFADRQLDEAAGDQADAWDQAALFLGEEQQARQTFKQPEVLRFIEGLQDYLKTTGVVGKSNSLADITKTVYRELMEGKDEYFRVPDTSAAVAQCLIQYESSHRPQDLAHFVLRDESDPAVHFRKTVLWLQLTSGDNRDMQRVVEAVDRYLRDHGPPAALAHHWFGLTYINVVWQDRMVHGMLSAFLGSFLVVLLMMILLFRSGLWGLLSMIPLTVTVGVIYGIIGLVGKDYDMPTAVLSSLTLGLAVDYAIHFLARSRSLREKYGSWKEAVPHVFGEPARAITRNVVVVGVGFLPLLAAPLVPYKTVGVFMAAILVLAGVATLLILPALMKVLRPLVFPESRPSRLVCQCGTCIVASATAVGLVALNILSFFAVGWTTLTWFSLPAVAVLAIGCAVLSRRETCRREAQKSSSEGGDAQ